MENSEKDNFGFNNENAGDNETEMQEYGVKDDNNNSKDANDILAQKADQNNGETDPEFANQTKEDKEKSALDEVAIIPGSPDDPFRWYRWSKQVCLVLVWICIVSTGSVFHVP